MSHSRRKFRKTCEACFFAGIFLVMAHARVSAQSSAIARGVPVSGQTISVAGDTAGVRAVGGSSLNWDRIAGVDSGVPAFFSVPPTSPESVEAGPDVRAYRIQSSIQQSPHAGTDVPGNVPVIAPSNPAREPAPIAPFGLQINTPGAIADPAGGAADDCNACRTDAIYLFHGYSSWRGVAEGSGANNNGFLYGANYGTSLGDFTDSTGIEGQVGASYGLYDLNGRASGYSDNSIQQQTFITIGLSRKSDAVTNFSGGVVFDTMINDHFGQYASSPVLGQLRAQVAYTLHPRHEIGVWAAIRMFGDHGDGAGAPQYRGVDQFNFFWHHKFDFGADGWTWVGFPDHSKLGGNGTLGTYTLGGTLTAPLSERFGLYTDLQYMAPGAETGLGAAMEETFYIGLGVIFFPDRNSRTSHVIGERWMPYLPVANNGSFLVDASKTF